MFLASASGSAGRLIWWLTVCVCRNEKAAQLPSTPLLTREGIDPETSSQETPGSVGTDPHRIMGKEVKEEQNRLKGFTVCSFDSVIIVQLSYIAYFSFYLFLALASVSPKESSYRYYGREFCWFSFIIRKKKKAFEEVTISHEKCYLYVFVQSTAN